MANNIVSNNYHPNLISFATVAGIGILGALSAPRSVTNAVVNNVANVGKFVFRAAQAHPVISVLGVMGVGACAGFYYMGWDIVVVKAGKSAVNGVVNFMNNKRDSILADRILVQAEQEFEKEKKETEKNKTEAEDCRNRTQELKGSFGLHKKAIKETNLVFDDLENNIKKYEDDK